MNCQTIPTCKGGLFGGPAGKLAQRSGDRAASEPLRRLDGQATDGESRRGRGCSSTKRDSDPVRALLATERQR